MAVRDVKDIKSTLESVYRSGDMSRLFQISPRGDNRSLESSKIEPVSEWALDQFMARLEEDDQRATYDMYRRIRWHPELRGRIWQNRVHKYFCSLPTMTQFSIYPLGDSTANPLTIEFISDTKHTDFARFQDFGGLLTSSVMDQRSCYLRPLSKTFATFDSFLYQPGFHPSNFQPLICFQITDALKHDIHLSGLQGTQTACRATIPELKALRPSVAKKWIIVFVMPTNMGSAFGLQKIVKESSVWMSKTAQYHLELSPEAVMRC